MANIRLGQAFAATEIINLLNKVKPPYNISEIDSESCFIGDADGG